MASGTNVRDFFGIEAYPLFSVGFLAPIKLHCLDANCGMVVPSQGFLSLREVLVWRHTEVGYVRNRTLEVQQRGNTSESASRSQDDLEVL